MEFITYEQEGFVGVLTINRPKALNALNSQVLTELEETIDAIDINTHRCRRKIIRCRCRYRRNVNTYKSRR